MAVDEALLCEVSEAQAPPQTHLRFYQWRCPTVSLGLSQKPEQVINLDYCRSHGIEIVQRPTGGKAVLHDRELTYSVVSNDSAFFPSANIGKTYCRIASALQRGFRLLGLETTLAAETGKRSATGPLSSACFALSGHHEVLWQGRKLVGSAQRRRKNAFLQHGSILIDFDVTSLSRVLRSCESALLSSAVADLKTCLGTVPPVGALVEALSKGFEAAFAVRLVEDGPRTDVLVRFGRRANASKFSPIGAGGGNRCPRPL
ncbi:MAG: lipoate--protein ligase family protein [Acidimicrobiia bacterium]|nr:lipoate--protein ligase family protein [Acidimicrobiia bacterium]